MYHFRNSYGCSSRVCQMFSSGTLGAFSLPSLSDQIKNDTKPLRPSRYDAYRDWRHRILQLLGRAGFALRRRVMQVRGGHERFGVQQQNHRQVADQHPGFRMFELIML